MIISVAFDTIVRKKNKVTGYRLLWSPHFTCRCLLLSSGFKFSVDYVSGYKNAQRSFLSPLVNFTNNFFTKLFVGSVLKTIGLS